MMLLTKELKRKLPKLYSAEDVPMKDHVVICKFFDPCGAYTFYVLEGDPEEDDYRLFGFASGVPCPEFGYVMLSELQEYRGPLHLGIERDLWWTPTKVSEIKEISKYLASD